MLYYLRGKSIMIFYKMKNIKILILLLGLFLLGTNIYTLPKKLTLEQCIKIGLKRNKQLMSAIEKAQSEKFKLNEAKANLYYPDISLSSSYSYQDQQPTQTFPISPHNIRTSLSINKVIFSGGLLIFGVKIAEISAEIAELEEIQAKKDLVRNIKMAFFNIIFSTKSYEVFKRSNELLKKQYDIQKKRFDRGVTSEFDYLRVQIQYENDSADLENRKMELIKAKNNMYLLLSIPTPEEMELENYIEFVGEIPVDEDIMPLKDALSKAKEKSIDFVKIKKQRNILEYSQEIAATGYKPQVVLFGSANLDFTQPMDFSFANGSPSFVLGEIEPKFSFSVGVQVRFSLTDLLFPASKTRSKVSSIEKDLRSLDYAIDLAEDNLKKEVKEHYYSLKSGLKRIKIRKEIVESAEKNFVLAQDYYKRGIIDKLNYDDIDLQYKRTQLSYYGELLSYNILLLKYKRFIGE